MGPIIDNVHSDGTLLETHELCISDNKNNPSGPGDLFNFNKLNSVLFSARARVPKFTINVGSHSAASKGSAALGQPNCPRDRPHDPITCRPIPIPNYDEPLIIRSLASSWPCCKLWTIDYLETVIDHPLKFRLVERNSVQLHWETECTYVFASVGQFRDWVEGTSTTSSPFSSYPFDYWWAYADYIYLNNDDGFEQLNGHLCWKDTFCGTDATPLSTFWLGSSESNTICHYDTYGINLYVQVFGKKQWILFPNSDTPYLYPTRLPLEESTVFSEVNFPKPDLIKYPLLDRTSPRSVILEPGDVLFIPRGWWHFVQSTKDSPVTCSVNWWIDQPKLDDSFRLREALTQLVGFSLLSHAPSIQPASLLHPVELSLFQSGDWFALLAEHVRKLLAQRSLASSPSNSPTKSVPASIWKPLDKKFLRECFSHMTPSRSVYSVGKSASAIDQQLIKSFLQPDVIDLIGRHLECSDLMNDTQPQDIPCTPAELKAPEPIRLNCKFHAGKCVLSNLNSDSTFLDLLTSVGSAVGLNPLELTVFVGYPPRLINWTEATLGQKLNQIPIVSGDTLTINTSTKKPPPNAAPAISTAPPATKAAASPVKTNPHIVRLTAPSDNACLFTSVLFCVDNAGAHQPINTTVRTNPTAVAQLRELIAGVVRNDPQQYSEAFLEMPNSSYCLYIQDPNRWGGGIEVAILSQVFELEICVVDVQSGRIDRFGEDRNYQRRILLLYDGIHYDPLAQAHPTKARLTSVFSTKDEQILIDAQMLAAEARAVWEFTDTASFTLLCRQCQVPLIGQTQAQQHAKQTGHTEFSEIPP